MTDTDSTKNEVKFSTGIVRSVTSGNRLIIREPVPKAGRPPLEKILVLQHVTCPEPGRQIIDRLTNKEQITPDARGAWEAREFTRLMFLGQPVKFSIEYEWENIEQVAGNVWLEKETPGKDSGLIEKGLKAGWFQINEKQSYLISQTLKDLALDAKNYSRGLYNNSINLTARNITWGVDEKSAPALVKRLGKKRLRGQVEYVLSGSTLKVYLVDEQTYLIMQLTGVRCNSLTGKTPEEKLFSQEAKYFVESRVLNRDIEVVLDYWVWGFGFF